MSILNSPNLILTQTFYYIQQIKHWNTHNFVYFKYFNIFLLYKYLFLPLNNTTLSNQLKSIKFNLLNCLSSSLGPKKNTPNHTYKCVKVVNLYNNIVHVVKLFIHKSVINKLLIFKLYLILLNYQSVYNFFNPTKNEILLNSNLYFLTFTNLFYFKIRNF